MREWLTVANVVTATRLGFWGGFVVSVRAGAVELAVICFGLAWGLDAVDGWLARGLQQVTRVGYVFDKLVDRLVIIGSVGVLWWWEWVPAVAWFLLLKDLVALPTLGWQVARGQLIKGLGVPGKLITGLQGGALLWLLLDWPGALLVVGVVSFLGVGAGAHYAWRMRRR